VEESKPTSNIIQRRRWQMIGRVLRMEEQQKKKKKERPPQL